MLLNINQSVDHGFDSPIGLLGDCHRRVERFLGILVSITREWQGRPLPPSERDLLGQACRYFEVAGPKHTADEEVSLFPRLDRLDDEDVKAVLETARALEADHRTAERLHAAADEKLRAWLAGGELPSEDVRALTDTLDQLARLYEQHIRIEDTQVFPAAARALQPADLEAIGREMAARRNVAYLPPPDLGTQA